MGAAQEARIATLVSMTLVGKSQREIGEAIGRKERTVRALQQRPDVAEAIAAAAQAREAASLTITSELRDVALAVVREQMASTDANVRYRAARLALQHHTSQHRIHEAVSQSALETALAALIERARRGEL